MRMQNSFWRIVALIISAAGAFSQTPEMSPEQFPEEGEVIRLRPVKVDFSVRKNRTVVDDLTSADFRVEEEVRIIDNKGKSKLVWREPSEGIKSFWRGEDLPLRFVLCVDTSESVFKSQAGPLKLMLQNFVRSVMRPEKDAMLILPFGTYVHEFKPDPKGTGKLTRREFSSDQAELLYDIEHMPIGISTPLFDALEASIRRLGGEAQERGLGEYALALLLITDGRENASRIYKERFGNNELRAYYAKKESLEQALRRMDNVPVYVLYTGSSEEFRAPLITNDRGALVGTAMVTAYDWLRGITKDTGGSLFDFNSPKRQTEALARIQEELTNRYSLVFYPADSAPGETFRRIRIAKVRLDKKGNSVADRQYAVTAPPGFTF